MINIVNPWGIPGQFEAQRSDIWELDLSPVVQLVLNPTGVVQTTEYHSFKDQIIPDQANAFVQRVVLPEISVEGLRVIVGTQNLTLPGYDECLTPTRIDFIHEATGFNENDNPRASTIFCILNCWFMLAMAGQQRFNRVQLPLLLPTSKPSFKTNLELTLLKGSEDGSVLDDGAGYNLLDCWISDFQVQDYDVTKCDYATITATLQIGAITLKDL